MTVKFYTDSVTRVVWFDGHPVIPGDIKAVKVGSDKVNFKTGFASNYFNEPLLITEVLDAEGNATYTSFEDIISKNKDFFVKAAGGISSGIEVVNALGYTPASKVDGKVPISELPSALVVGAIETARSQSLDKAPASKLFDDELNKKTSYAVGKNKFNKTKAVNGYISNTTGVLTTSGTDYMTSDYIAVTSGLTYAISSPNSVLFSCFFDSNKNVIAGGVFSSSTKVFTIPANVVYVRFSFKGSSIDTVQLEAGTSQTTFEAYKEYNLENVVPLIVGSQSFLNGVEFYSIFDSLGTVGTWQFKLASLTGGVFDNVKNNNSTYPLSVGGTGTIGNFKNCGQWRARNLVANYPSAKVIFLENINDMNIGNGSVSDAPFMLSRIDNLANQGLTSITEANTYWTNNFSTIVAGYVPAKGVVINIPFYGSGKNVRITGLPTSNGNVTLTVGGVNYSIAVTTSDTIASLIAKILEYQYGLYVDTANADGISVDFYYSAGATVTFNAVGTGMTVSITDTTTAVVYTPRYYYGEANSTDWNNSAKWSSSQPLNYSAMRGLIEYLQTNLPTAELIWIIPTRYSTTYTSYLRADGTKDIDAYLAADTAYQNLCTMQKAVCDLYNIRYVDLNKRGGITLNNFSTYYNENNVHPKTSGYEKWAEMIYRLIK